jgi:hypothetical protein
MAMIADDKKYLDISITDVDGTTSLHRIHDDAVPWPDLLMDFIDLLTAAGYGGVKERISLEDSPFMSSKWDGLVHPEETDDDR